MAGLPKFLIIVGLAIAGLGAVLWVAPHVPGLDRLGKLPGDIRIERGNTRFYFPWVTCLVLSGLLTLVMYLIGRFRS
jgi:hypothetical protein